MPIPRTLLSRQTPSDVDLGVVAGSWPEGLTGELVLTAPHPETLGGPHPFFGEGIVYRLSLQAGTHGAAPGSFAWRHRRIDSPSAVSAGPSPVNSTHSGVRPSSTRRLAASRKTSYAVRHESGWPRASRPYPVQTTR